MPDVHRKMVEKRSLRSIFYECVLLVSIQRVLPNLYSIYDTQYPWDSIKGVVLISILGALRALLLYIFTCRNSVNINNNTCIMLRRMLLLMPTLQNAEAIQFYSYQLLNGALFFSICVRILNWIQLVVVSQWFATRRSFTCNKQGMC